MDRRPIPVEVRMDSFTLLVASVLAALIMTGAMAMLYRASSRELCLLDWSAAGALFAACFLLSMAALGHTLPFALTPGLNNACYVAGHYTIAAGLRRHLGMRPRYGIVLAIAGTVWLLHFTPFVQASVGNRLLLFTPVVMGANLSVLWLCRQVRDRNTRSAFLPLAVLECLFLLQLLVREVLIMDSRHGPTMTFNGSKLLQASGSWALLLFLSVVPMACALIVIRKQELALRKASLTDSMTGWLNRRALQETAEKEFRHCMHHGAPLAFLVFDIDHFKRVNDQHGHAAGDQAICHVTSLAAQALRSHDGRFRIGGEEFTVLFSGQGLEQARSAGERIRRLIEKSALERGELRIGITVSMGLAEMKAHDTSWEEVLARADAALYHAKQNGRNRLCEHSQLPCEQALPTSAEKAAALA
jgi:diguanylate cyclase (GGDEF)-like protein